MRTFKSRFEEATFELNLAPMLDIIVSIVPMLLLSVVFVQISAIDTPIPQSIEKAIAASNEKSKDLVQISLSVSKTHGFQFNVTENGQTTERKVGLRNGAFDFEKLREEALSLKRAHPGVFRVELNPEESVALNEIVSVMDTVRMTGPTDPKVVFKDVDSGKPVETNLVFPDIVFGNVAGG
jgi:biopolymer transport protein ExbD